MYKQSLFEIYKWLASFLCDCDILLWTILTGSMLQFLLKKSTENGFAEMHRDYHKIWKLGFCSLVIFQNVNSGNSVCRFLQ